MRRLSCQRGFSLSEVVVVMFLISVLIGLAMPYYWRKTESARAGEVGLFMNALLAAQERCLFRTGAYFTGTGDLNAAGSCIDAEFAGGPPSYGLTNFQMDPRGIEGTFDCADGNVANGIAVPGYRVHLVRVAPNGANPNAAPLSQVYGPYIVNYDSCTRRYNILNDGCSSDGPTVCTRDLVAHMNNQ